MDSENIALIKYELHNLILFQNINKDGHNTTTY